MLPDPLQGDPLGLWHRLARAARPLLGLDYDGTLAPFQVDRMAAVPAPGAVEAVRAIISHGRTRVVVISGRLVDEVIALLGDLGVEVVGSHGFERRLPDGRRERVSLPPDLEQALARAAGQVERIGHGARLERKAASLAFHTRGLDGDAARGLEDEVARLWSGAGLSVQPFNGGVELHVGAAIDKGTVLAGMLDEHGPDLTVYVGDDRTDEDAFRTLARRGGLGIKVGPGPTAAVARLPGCEGVVRLLRRWLKAMESGEA